jgi:hypothetical protein
MVHTTQNLKTSKLNPGFEFHQLLVSLKYVINLVMRIRYTGCHNRLDLFSLVTTLPLVGDDVEGLRCHLHPLTNWS